MVPVQWQHDHLCQGIQSFAAFVQRHVINIVYVYNVHVLQCCYQIFWYDMRKEMSQWFEQEEDVLSYALFPQVATVL